MVIMMNSRFLKSKYWLDWFFPNRCPICNQVIHWNELICKNCSDKLPICDIDKNINKRLHTDSSFSLMYYKDNAINGIYALKNNNGINFAEFACKRLSEYMIVQEISESIDIVTCVPMAKKKIRKRGYDQAEIIARFMSKFLHKPLDLSLLMRSNSKTEQHKLNAEERKMNAEKAYSISPKHNDITGKRILICDDVITTGSTINKCADLLREIGADKVYSLSICKTSDCMNICSDEYMNMDEV